MGADHARSKRLKELEALINGRPEGFTFKQLRIAVADWSLRDQKLEEYLLHLHRLDKIKLEHIRRPFDYFKEIEHLIIKPLPIQRDPGPSS